MEDGAASEPKTETWPAGPWKGWKGGLETKHLKMENVSAYHRPQPIEGVGCMSGSIHYRKDARCWFILWYDRATGKRIKVYRYRGLKIYDRRIAVKLLAQMQGDQENGILQVEKYTKQEWSEPCSYLWKWLKAVESTLSPATIKDYENSIRNYLDPFFRKRRIYMHEIGFDTLQELANTINRSGKGKRNVMFCLHACLKYAWRSGRIPMVPPFPKIKYAPPPVRWLPEDRQMAIINAIPEQDRPIFLFLKYHLRRPGEACALKWEDWDGEVFTIRRGVSARRIVDSTKTGAVHRIPCHKDFREILERIRRENLGPFVFRNGLARTRFRNYTLESLGRIWKAACAATGESISLYAGLKHSTACQLVNDHGLSMSDLQAAGDWARPDSVKRYAVVEVARRKELLEGKVVHLGRVPKVSRGGSGGPENAE